MEGVASMDQVLSNKISNMGVVCAMLVVALHASMNEEVGTATWFVDRFVNDGLGRAAVPFFFVASGFFLAKHVGEPKWWAAAVRKRVKTLLVPHLFWNLLWILLPVVREFFKGLSHGAISVPAVHWPSPADWWGVLRPPPLGPTWYITTLFGFVLLSPLFVTLVRRCAPAALLSAATLHVAFYRQDLALWGTGRWLTQSVFNLEGIVFFLIGLDIALNKRKRPSRMQGNFLITLAFVATVVRMYAEAVNCPFLFDHARLFVIPGFLILLWRIVPSTQWPKWLVASAFPLYLVHYFAIDTLHRAICPHLSGLLLYGSKIGLAITISIAIGLAMRRVSGRLAALAFGGR